jgi:CheY-like chemotaxis protein
MIKLLRQTLPENITLHMQYDQNEYIVQADPTRLQQVIMNLALNARDAMPDGGQLQFELFSLIVTPEQAPPLPDMEEGSWVQLEIKDTGSGIAPEHIPRLFEPFFSTKAPGKGTGLGLAQVYGIVKQHGGSIIVDSQLGTGTIFTLFFPLLKTPTPPLKSALTDELAPAGNETILLVEDNPAMRRAVNESLNKLGYHILTATNGIEAVNVFIKHKDSIHLVISDLIMPEMGGMDLYRKLQQEQPAIKMIIMTGYGGDLINHEFLQQEGISFIQKPFNLINLAKMMRTQLDEPV